MNKVQYLITCLAEECAEVAQMCGKIQRFGLEETRRDETRTNRERLQDELGDIFTLLEMLRDEGVVVWPDNKHYEAKRARKEKYMDYSRQLGLLN